MNRVGFTGTQLGMTYAQQQKFYLIITKLNPEYFYHGDCVGADAAAHTIVNMYIPECKKEIFPPKYGGKRAYCKNYYKMHPKDDFLPRNKKIVAASDILIATPKETEEVLRSGTWATIRYAKAKGIPIYIIWPEGDYEIWSPPKKQ